MSRKLHFSNWQWVIVIITIFGLLIWQARIIKNRWSFARGYEQEWIAGSLLGGYGYSFDPVTAWLGPYGDRTAYTPTAWAEPLYTIFIATIMNAFGEYGRLILVLFNIVWLSASAVMVFLLVGKILNYPVGVSASLLFLIVHACKPEVILYIGNAALAGFLACLSAYLLLRCLENPSLVNGIFLGVVIGIANLNHAGSFLFAPLSALAVLLGTRFRKRKSVWLSSIAVLTTTIIVISPWTIRNYLVFDKLIPIRNGFGYQLYIGNPGLARTFSPGLNFDAADQTQLWTANGPWESLRLLRDLKYDAALADHSIRVVSESTTDFSSYNEAERDREFLFRSLTFLLAEPLLTLKMMFWKMIAFLTYWKISLALISLAAFIGGLLMIKDIRVASLLLFVMAYMTPFVSSLPLYYRYRSSIEPLLFVLAGLFLGICFQKAMSLWNVLQNRFPWMQEISES